MAREQSKMVYKLTNPNWHPTAVVDHRARIAPDAVIGPYSVVGPDVTIGPEVVVKSHTVIEGLCEIGHGTRIASFCTLGIPPQDFKYRGEKTRLVIGSYNDIRENVTMSLGTVNGGGITVVGDRNFIMVGVHLGHDVQIGNQTIITNGTQFGGHVEIGDHVVIGGVSAFHPFVHVGSYAHIAGHSMVSKDVLPYMRVAGDRARLLGINERGLKDRGFSTEQISMLKKCFRELFFKQRKLKDAFLYVSQLFPDVEEVQTLISFYQKSKRGICHPRGNR